MLDYQPDLDKAAIEAAYEFSQTSPAIVQTLSEADLASLKGPNAFTQQVHRIQAAHLLESFKLNQPWVNQRLLTGVTIDIVAAMNPEERSTLLHSIKQQKQNEHALHAAKLILAVQFSNTETNERFFDSLLKPGVVEAAEVLKLTKSDPHSTELAIGSIQHLLKTAIEELPSAIKSQYSHESDTSYLMDVIQYMPRATTSKLLLDMHSLSLLNTTAHSDLNCDWDNAIQSLTINERAEIIRTILKENTDDISYTRVQQSMECSSSIQELCILVETIGESTLLKSEHQGLKELCAIARLYPAVAAVPFPSTPESTAGIDASRTCLEDTIKAYEAVIGICKNSEEFKYTRTASDLSTTALSAIADIKTDLYHWEIRQAEKADSPSNAEVGAATIKLDASDGSIIIEGRIPPPPAGNLREELHTLASTHIKMASIERTYGVNITYSNTSLLDLLAPAGYRGMPLWTMEELNAIEAGLQKIPIEHIIFTPLLREIEKVSMIGPGVLAARYNDGKVRITPQAANSKEMKRHYPDIHPLTFVFVHELGHSIQIGDEESGTVKNSLDSLTLATGEQKYDFHAFTEISNWRLITNERFELIIPEKRNSPLKVKLDGELYALGSEVIHQGEKLILQIDPSGTVLYACDAESEFASRWYAKANPWEDFAETFAEYILTPERLLDLAPAKFFHMEAEFKKYSNSGELQNLIDQKL